MPFQSGTYNFPTPSGCPTGSTTEYSIDGGTTWTTTQPTYPNSPGANPQPFDLCIRCTCGGNSGPTTCVTVTPVDPDTCCPTLTAPTAPTVTDSACV